MELFLKPIVFLFFTMNISAQCYIQYTYNTSGNRTSRVYVGGCPVRPGTIELPQIEMQPDTLQGATLESRTERIRLDMDEQIKLYPNPTDGIITIRLDKYEPSWVYCLSTVTGRNVLNAAITDYLIPLHVSTLLAGPYLFTIYDSSGQIIYQTNIIKK